MLPGLISSLQTFSVPWHENGAIVNEVNFSPMLGAAEISLSHLPVFLQRLMEGSDGRIPLRFVANIDAARREQARFVKCGLNGWLTDHEQTFGPSGKRVPLNVRGLSARVQALLCRHDVDALVILGPGSGKAA